MTAQLKTYPPTTPGQRQATGISFRGLLTKKEPEKSLVKGRRRSAGRNSQGRITIRHRGGGVKRLLREVDFVQDKVGIPGRVEALEYDPGRSAFLALVIYRDGEYRYILAPDQLKVGDNVLADAKAPLEVGNRLPLARMPVGTMVHNVALQPGSGGGIARSAGSSAVVLAHEAGWTHLKLPSGEVRKVSSGGWASIGAVSNPFHQHVTYGKAGRLRRKGVRPTVRGSAMNPRDHPLGGGEGRTMRGMSLVKNKWGKPVRGVKTRKRGKYSDRLILQRRK